jgi:hypothetical protein
MRINDTELERSLVALRTLLGDARIDELCEEACRVAHGLSTEECMVLAEALRLIAEVRAWQETLSGKDHPPGCRCEVCGS